MEESIWSRKDIISQPYWTFQVLHPPCPLQLFICSSIVWIIQHENGKIFTNVAGGIRCGSRGTPQAVAICAWPWLFVLAAAVCSFLLKISKNLGLNIILTILIQNI
jgi:hypothetical protein